jgi:hypothetical protein
VLALDPLSSDMLANETEDRILDWVIADYYQKHCYNNASACMQKKRFTYVVFLAKNGISADEHITTLLAVLPTYSDNATSDSSMLSSASTVVETTVKTALLE